MVNIEKNVNPLAEVLKTLRPALWAVAMFSLFINLLMLTAPLYMLQVYDRVLVSRSHDTLLFLSIVALGALCIFGLLEFIRSRVLIRVSGKFDQDLSKIVFKTVMRTGSSSQPFKDLDIIRSFFTGPSLLALFDSPWTPIYIAIIYFLHPLLGHVVLVGALVLFIIAVTNELLTRKPLQNSAIETAQANQFTESSSRNHDAIKAMGMLNSLTSIWKKWHDAGLAYQSQASDRASYISGSAKFVRFFIQVCSLGVGAYLAINEIITPGTMIAASIISSRALSPIESAIGGWRSFLLARDSRRRLSEYLEHLSEEPEHMELPVPKGSIHFDNVYAIPPGAEVPVVSGINFQLLAGQSLGLTGPSAAGKSSIARLMVGAWTPYSGKVRLDKAELTQWDSGQLGQYIGYLPQDVELFSGTVADNIARFGKIDPRKIVQATKLAGAHDTILTLADGYETSIGAGGENLSGGQRQKIGIARAFYGQPSLIVLDEPTSNLDAIGEAAIRNAIEILKKSGSTVVIIAHKPIVVGGVDNLMVIQNGTMTHFGPTDEVMPKITRKSVVEHENAPRMIHDE